MIRNNATWHEYRVWKYKLAFKIWLVVTMITLVCDWLGR